MATKAADQDLAELLVSRDGIQDPYPIYRRLQEDSPVYRSDKLKAWFVTSHHDVREVYRSHDRFSNVGKMAGNIYALPAEVRRQVPLVEMVETLPALSSADQPAHTRQRALVIRSLTPRRLKAKQEWMESLCGRLADSLAAEPEPDLIRHFSFPLAYQSILGLFGAPLEHIPLYQEATQARQAFTSVRGTDPNTALRYERAIVALKGAIESIYPRLRDQGDGTIINSLLNPPESGGKLTDDELFLMLKNFFAAGQENIIYSIPSSIFHLLQHPDQLKAVRSDPSLAPDAFEEAVRFDTPAQQNPRIVAVDCELNGQSMLAGEQVLNFKGAANRDPSAWTDPDRFDIFRDQGEPDGGSVAFGQGIHFCAGAGIARLEVPVAIGTLLERFPNIQLHEAWSPTWINEPTVRKLTELPLKLG